MLAIQTVLSLIIALLFTGCAAVKGSPPRSYDIKAELQALQPYHSPDIITQYEGKKSPQERMAFRDKVVFARLRAMNLQFALFEQNIAQERTVGAVGVDWAVLGLSGAGAITPVASTKAILAAISGGLTGARASVNEHVYYQKTMPVLLGQMEALRKDVLERIVAGLAKPDNEYSLYQALFDLDEYYKAGTIPGALIGIAANSGETLKKADQGIKEIMTGTYIKDPAGNILRKRWKPYDKTINKEFEEKLEKWMVKNNVKESIPSFLRKEEYSELRKKAVNDPELMQ